jgi:hypothetical protein
MVTKRKKPKSAAKAKRSRANPAKQKRPARAVARSKATSTKKATAKRKSPSKAAPKVTASKRRASTAKPIRRRDATGHLDPKYARDLLEKSKHPADDDQAFLSRTRTSDDLAEELGEEFVEAATTGEYEAEESLNRSVSEERGGPFVPSTGGAEFAGGTDASNPKGARREPFPRT